MPWLVVGLLIAVLCLKLCTLKFTGGPELQPYDSCGDTTDLVKPPSSAGFRLGDKVLLICSAWYSN
ncbi:MAG: hypothetical protein COC19_06730 [SAR86 cluster bacterium]|uniref:Uncharacterized protein n=1 Tax=SAR86 cluster bacterium TaxID=2030880 RepID=A0A2A4MJ19_9GAMM|nr:MAG: hypothetical protein COC19_06730 [SAR86 cluster bacterium]